MSGSGQRVRKGEKEETRRAEEERDPCGGGQDGWTAGSHAKERKKGGRGKLDRGEGKQDEDKE